MNEQNYNELMRRLNRENRRFSQEPGSRQYKDRDVDESTRELNIDGFFTGEGLDNERLLKAHIKRLGRLSDRGALEAVKLAQKGDRRAMTQLVEKHLWLADRETKHFLGQGLTYSELISAAMFAMQAGIRRFDPSRGVPFAAYLTGVIQRAMMTAVRGNIAKNMGVTEHVLRNVKLVEDFQSQHFIKYGRMPTEAQISEGIGLGKRAIRNALQAFDERSFMESTKSTIDEDGDVTVLDVHVTESNPVEDAVVDQDTLEQLQELQKELVKELEDVEILIAQYRFDQGLSEREVADKLMVTRYKVRTTEESIKNLVRTRSRQAGIELEKLVNIDAGLPYMKNENIGRGGPVTNIDNKPGRNWSHLLQE